MALRRWFFEHRGLRQLRHAPADGHLRPPSLRRRAAVTLFALLLLTGCRSNERTTPQRGVDPPGVLDPWILRTTWANTPRGNHGVFLGNGYIGATFGPTGGSAGVDARTYVAGIYDASEALKPQPNWHDFELALPGEIGGYEQSLDMKRGVLTTKWDGGVTVTSFVSAADPNLCGVRIVGATPKTRPAPGEWEIEDKTTGTTWTRLARFRQNKSQPFPTFDDALKAHEAAWAARWKSDIVIDGDVEAQQIVRKMLFDLMQSARPGGDDSVAPETLSGDFYKGHIFWDAEVWIFPALLAQHPDLARNILDYRFRHLAEARSRAKAAGFAGADFPWESAASGKETAPGGFSKGRHVNAGVGWAHWQYWLATGDKNWLATRGWPVLSAVADYWASRATKNAAGKYDVKDVFGPDETKGAVDNNAYTNAMARYCLLAAADAARVLGRPANPRWTEVAKNIAIPFDAANHRYLTRDADDGKPTKQADGELVLYPAALPMDADTANATFDFQAKRPIQNGPAMTASIHALIAARLGRAAEADTYFRDAYRPFIRGPFVLFSEKRSLDRCVFATGAGGLVQSVVYGFGGLDWANFDRPAKPALPANWKSLKIIGVQRHGKRYTLTVTPTQRTLKIE